ncbi:NAD-dependent epimerase/dehydratase family protein [Candidatus Micrarchaeota archaeon]|nr:NAD-dependent epimerase/dehydratase family protein [Candidatus Micrarchaeota archaeon]
MSVLVTGGAGFIASHLVDVLVSKQSNIVVLDDLSSGKKENVNKKAKLIVKDIVRDDIDSAFKGVSTVFHFAADPLVKESAENPAHSFNINVSGTFRVLEACRKNNVKKIVFASTSTVYGDAAVIPTPETALLEPVSNYGASKLANEAYVSSYCHTYGMRGVSLRFANIFGPRSTHGVMKDFFFKLKKNAKQLEILGDGKQDKSYLFVSDCIEAILLASEKSAKAYSAFNVGSSDKMKVLEVARIVCEIMRVSPDFSFTGGKRGWVGDVPVMLLDTKKICALGWKQKTSFKQGVKKYVEWLKTLTGFD